MAKRFSFSRTSMASSGPDLKVALSGRDDLLRVKIGTRFELRNTELAASKIVLFAGSVTNVSNRPAAVANNTSTLCRFANALHPKRIQSN